MSDRGNASSGEVDPGGGREPSLPPLARLHPTVLVVCFAVVLGAVLALDPADPAEAPVSLGAAGLWTLLSGLRPRRVGALLLFGLGLFLPFFLLAPWVEGGAPAFDLPGHLAVTTEGLLVPTRIVARGLAVLLLGAGLASSADLTTLATGLAKVPLMPRALVVMTVQILRWAAVLVEEGRGVARAVRLRGRGGVRGSLELARSLPLVWLPRVMARAERVAATMEVRGYGGELPDRQLPPLGAPDAAGLSAAAALALLAALDRWWS